MAVGVKIHLTEAETAYIRDNFLTMPVDAIAAHLGLKKTFVRHTAYAMGLKKFVMDWWSPVMVEFLEFVYPVLGDTEIAEYFEKHFPKSKPWSKKHIEKKRRYLSLKRTKAMHNAIRERNRLFGCFAVGHALMWEKRGITPVGTIRDWSKDNKRVVVIKTDDGFVNYFPWLWEKHNGPVPDGFVVYAPPDVPAPCDVSALSLKTRTEMMEITRMTDTVVIKRNMKIRDPEMVETIKQDHPHLVELKRGELKLKRKLNELNRKDKPV